jgi:osmotically-inducible protein OsmY
MASRIMKSIKRLNAFSGILCVAAAGTVLVTASGCISSGRPHETLTQDQEDRDITSRVETGLHATDYKFPDVKVETINRAVELSGAVDSAAHKNEAGLLAQQGVDVKEVINHVTIR